MRSTIDRAGRIVVPKSIRERLHLRGGETVDLEEHDGVIEIRPAVADIEVVETGEGPVFHAVQRDHELTIDLVRNTVEVLRNERPPFRT